MAPFSASDITTLSDIGPSEIIGDPGATASGLAALGDVDARGRLSFCTLQNAEGADAIARSAATIVLCHTSVVAHIAATERGRAILAVADPRLAFSIAAAAFCPTPKQPAKIHADATIDASALIHATVHVGPRAVVGPDCQVGEGSVIGAGALLHRNVKIGRNCRIHAGAVLGARGFGFCRTQDGRLIPFPQIGGVVIEDDVEIGANTCIDSGALVDTRVGPGTRIDDLVYVAHNVEIGRNCLIMAGVILCGSSKVGDQAELSPGVIVRDKRCVGECARVGLGAVVVSDVEAGTTVAGVPARQMTHHAALSQERG